MTLSARRALLVAALGAFGGIPAAACGWYSTPLFYSTKTPSPPIERFLAGDLGVISPAWKPAALLVAFRVLDGSPLDPATQKAFRTYWEPETDPDLLETGDTTGAWRSALERAGAAPEGWITRERDITDPAGTYGGFYFNCLDDAFATAAKTLDARVERYGAGSREVTEWISGQRTVFANCARGEAEPPELDESWDARLRADRAYQRAAAAFYSERFELAGDRFRAIAEDRRSEWSSLARYLVARSRVRAKDVDGALAALKSIRADAQMTAYHAAADRLTSFVLTHWKPQDRERELAAVLFGSTTAPSLRQALIDYTVVLGSDSTQPDPRSRELAAWVAALKSTEPGLVFERFRDKPSLPWLIAALRFPAPDEDTSHAVLEAARAVPASSPGYLTVRSLLAERLAAGGQIDEARVTLDALLALDETRLSMSDRNWLQAQRSQLAVDFAEYFALRTQTAVGESDSEREWLFTEADAPDSRSWTRALSEQALNVLNLYTPLDELARLLHGSAFPEEWRLQLALMGFARAELAGNATLTRAFAKEISSREPTLREELDRWERERNTERRTFLAALFLARRPGALLDLQHEMARGDLEDINSGSGNWWCAQQAPLQWEDDDSVRWPAFLGAEPKLERPTTESAPLELGRRVLAYADAHREDPDVPEALHHIVRATRYGCRDVSYGEISKAAFDRLHRRYPKSEWTDATPYWFD